MQNFLELMLKMPLASQWLMWTWNTRGWAQGLLCRITSWRDATLRPSWWPHHTFHPADSGQQSEWLLQRQPRNQKYPPPPDSHNLKKRERQDGGLITQRDNGMGCREESEKKDTDGAGEWERTINSELHLNRSFGKSFVLPSKTITLLSNPGD